MDKDKKYNYAAILLCALACCGWSYVLDLEYYRLYYYSWDLPLYANLMWNLCHGSLSTSLFGGNFLIDHFNVIAFLLVPFYFFFQSALTMLYFKLFAFFAGAYIFYLLTAKRLGGLWGITFMLAYMFYPANVSMLFFEFNFENLALPVIFLLFYYFEEKKFLSFMVCSLLLTTVKENMPLVVFMFGIYGFLKRREDWRWGLYPLILGAAMFIAEVFVFIPWLRHGFGAANAHWSLYSRLGKTPQEILYTLIFKIPQVFQLLFNNHNILFLLKLFGPLLIAALLAPGILLLAAPLFLQDLLSRFPGQQSIDFFYSSTLTVFIFMATVDFLGRVNSKFKKYILGFMLILLFIFDAWFMPQWCRKLVPYQEKQVVSRYFLSQIPPDAKVISSYKFLYLLSQRKDLYVLSLKHKIFIHEKEVVPDTVDYMMVDFASRVDNKDSVKQLLSQGQWMVQAAADEVVLLRKQTTRKGLLIESSNNPMPLSPPIQPVIMAGDALKMEGLQIPSSLKFGQRIMPVFFYWKTLKDDKNTNLPQISLSIFQSYRRFYLKNRTPFYGLPLSKDEYDREVFYYFIPRLSPGDYRVVISSLPSKENKNSPVPQAIYIKNISVLL